jgi:hypothetical protein
MVLFDKEPDATEKAVADVKKNPLNGYDKYSLLYDGIKAWTYPSSLERVAVVERTPDGHEVTVQRVPAIEDLDEAAVDFFATEILRLTKPSLFQTPEEQEAAAKNG